MRVITEGFCHIGQEQGEESQVVVIVRLKQAMQRLHPHTVRILRGE